MMIGDALVVTVKDKSAARKAEATALKKPRALGVPLLSTSDAANVHSDKRHNYRRVNLYSV